MRETVIVSAVRTPTGKFLGALKSLSATQLGALTVADAVRRTGIDPAIVDAYLEATGGEPRHRDVPQEVDHTAG